MLGLFPVFVQSLPFAISIRWVLSVESNSGEYRIKDAFELFGDSQNGLVDIGIISKQKTLCYVEESVLNATTVIRASNFCLWWTGKWTIKSFKQFWKASTSRSSCLVCVKHIRGYKFDDLCFPTFSALFAVTGHASFEFVWLHRQIIYWPGTNFFPCDFDSNVLHFGDVMPKRVVLREDRLRRV